MYSIYQVIRQSGNIYNVVKPAVQTNVEANVEISGEGILSVEGYYHYMVTDSSIEPPDQVQIAPQDIAEAINIIVTATPSLQYGNGTVTLITPMPPYANEVHRAVAFTPNQWSSLDGSSTKEEYIFTNRILTGKDLVGARFMYSALNGDNSSNLSQSSLPLALPVIDDIVITSVSGTQGAAGNEHIAMFINSDATTNQSGNITFGINAIKDLYPPEYSSYESTLAGFEYTVNDGPAIQVQPPNQGNFYTPAIGYAGKDGTFEILVQNALPCDIKITSVMVQLDYNSSTKTSLPCSLSFHINANGFANETSQLTGTNIQWTGRSHIYSTELTKLYPTIVVNNVDSYSIEPDDENVSVHNSIIPVDYDSIFNVRIIANSGFSTKQSEVFTIAKPHWVKIFGASTSVHALRSDNTLWAIGSGQQLGIGVATANTLTQCQGTTWTIKDVFCGPSTTYVITEAPKGSQGAVSTYIYSAGDNTSGALCRTTAGLGDMTFGACDRLPDDATPRKIVVGTNGGQYTTAICISTDNRAFMVGRGTEGQYGNGGTANSATWVEIASGNEVIDAVIVDRTVALLVKDATGLNVLTAGMNRLGLLGRTVTGNALTFGKVFVTSRAYHSETHIRAAGLSGWYFIDRSYYPDSDNALILYVGGNADGQVGNGTTNNAVTPTVIGTTTTSMYSNMGNTILLSGDTANNTYGIWACGANAQKQAGSSFPSPITTLTKVTPLYNKRESNYTTIENVSISANVTSYTVSFIKYGFDIYVAGSADMTGIGAEVATFTPVPTLINDPQQIIVSTSHVALLKDEQIYAWGPYAVIAGNTTPELMRGSV